MLVIRLARVGRKKQPHYRITVADSRRAAKGKFVAQIGHYNPHTKEMVANKDKLEHYLNSGAQPSSTVVKLLKKNKFNLPKWAEANLEVKNKKPKIKEEPNAAVGALVPTPIPGQDVGAGKAEEKPANGEPPEDKKPEDKAIEPSPTKTSTKPQESKPASPKEK